MDIPQIMNAGALTDELAKRRQAALEKEIKRLPQHNPRASNIHECQRNIVYQVLDWDKAALFNEWLIARFEQGRREEKAVIEELRKDGFEIIDQDINGQLTITIPEQNTKEFRRGEVLTGRIDGLIKWGEKWLPFEVKSVDPNKFRGIKSLDDFQKNPLYRRYLRQMQVYLLGRNADEGLFILTDCLGHRMYIPVHLDYGETDWILKHLEKAARNIKAKSYPDRIAYDSSLCGKCQFAHICLNDVINKPADFIENEQLEADLDRHEELKPLAAEFDRLHDNIKGTFKGIPKAVVGGKYIVQSLPSNRTVYELPPDVEAQVAELKAAHAKKVPMERLVIQRLDGKQKDGAE